MKEMANVFYENPIKSSVPKQASSWSQLAPFVPQNKHQAGLKSKIVLF